MPSIRADAKNSAQDIDIGDEQSGEQQRERGDDETKRGKEAPGAGFDLVLMAGLPLLEQGEVTRVGFEESGGDGAEGRDVIEESVEQQIAPHSQEHRDADASADGLKENDDTAARGHRAADAGDERQDGIETDLEIRAGDAQEVIQPLREIPCHLGLDLVPLRRLAKHRLTEARLRLTGTEDFVDVDLVGEFGLHGVEEYVALRQPTRRLC